MLSDKVGTFFKELYSVVEKHVDGDYILLGVPKHMNLGDSLIWQAEKELLNTLPFKCKRTYFCYTQLTKIHVDPNDIIIFSGGGSWNDIWSTLPYIENIIQTYKNNKIFFMPNSVWYNNINRIKQTVRVIEQHKSEIILCSREVQSYGIATKYFPMIKSYLVPDVVLTWDVDKYLLNNNITANETFKTLFIHRNDKELQKTKLSFKYDIVSDWRTLKKRPTYALDSLTCIEWEKSVLPRLIKESCDFILPYKTVYSDRMHGAILAWLLGKETILLNNSYGKSKALYDTWLKDDKKIKCYE